MKNKYIKALFFGGLFFGALYLFNFLTFRDTERVCARVKKESIGGKGGKSLIYFYKYKGEIYQGSFNSTSGISLRLDVYKDKECFEVEVSTLFPSMSRVVVTKPKKKKYKLVFD